MAETPEQPKSSSADCLQIGGPLVISTVADWRTQIAAYLSTSKAREIDLGGVTSADVFGLQLLCSTRRSAAAHSQPITLTHLPPAIVEACQASGVTLESFQHP